MTAGGSAAAHRDLIVTLAARHKLPAVYFERSFVTAGGIPRIGWRLGAVGNRAHRFDELATRRERSPSPP